MPGWRAVAARRWPGVRLVAQHQEEWIQELSDAMTAVEGARNRGFPTRLLGGIP